MGVRVQGASESRTISLLNARRGHVSNTSAFVTLYFKSSTNFRAIGNKATPRSEIEYIARSIYMCKLRTTLRKEAPFPRYVAPETRAPDVLVSQYCVQYPVCPKVRVRDIGARVQILCNLARDWTRLSWPSCMAVSHLSVIAMDGRQTGTHQTVVLSPCTHAHSPNRRDLRT